MAKSPRRFCLEARSREGVNKRVTARYPQTPFDRRINWRGGGFKCGFKLTCDYGPSKNNDSIDE